MPRARAKAAIAAAAILALGLSAQSGAAATKYEPPDGKIYSGVATASTGAPLTNYLTVTDQPNVAIYNRFGGLGLADIQWVLDEFEKVPTSAGMLSWKVFQPSYDPAKAGGSNHSIANGEIDAYIIKSANQVRLHGKPVFMRPNWEMNADWFPWSVYDRAGNYQAENDFIYYRQAWQRLVEIFRGGSKAEIDARLAKLGMPGLTVNTAVTPVTNVSWVWCPSHSTKKVDVQAPGASEKHTPYAYYPGDAYVDWVGVDWYGYGTTDSATQFTNKATEKYGANELYTRLSGSGAVNPKPFMIGEWGMRDVDRVLWTQAFFDWIKARPEVKAQVYFSVAAADGDSRLELFPQAAAEVRAEVQGAKWIYYGKDVKDYSTTAPPPNTEDTTAPSITLSSPTAGQVLTGSVTVTPTVSDNVGVSSVRFSVDGTVMATDTSSPYSYTLDPSALSPGTHVLKVQAFDAAGNSSTKEVSFTVPAPDTTAPVITLSSPTAGQQLSGTVAITPGVTDDTGVTSVRFSVDGNVVATDSSAPYSHTLDTTELAIGSHTLKIEAWDAAGNKGTREVAFTVADTTAPALTLSTPTNGQVLSGDVSVAPTVSDNVGVSSVRYFVDGALAETDTSAPWAFTLKAGALAPGAHALKIVAQDAAGNSATHEVGFSVADTTAPVITLTSPTAGQMLGGDVPVRPTVTDNVGVSNTRFSVDGKIIATDSTAPYEYTLSTAGLAPGAHTLRIEAWDRAGNKAIRDVGFATGDVTAPTLTLPAPTEGQVLSGDLTVTPAVSDNVSVASVRWSVDGALVHTSTAAPWSFTLKAGALGAGAHTLKAVALDGAGNTTTREVGFTVADTTAPEVRIDGLADGAVLSGPVTIVPSLSDDVGVSRVRFLVDGRVIEEDPGDDASLTLDASALAVGSHTLRIEAVDAAGNTGAHEVGFLVPEPPDVTAPAVTISSPANGATVRGTVTVTPRVTDDRAVEEVRFLIDGELGETAGAGASWSFEASALTPGSHTIRVEAEDAAGNVGAHQVSVKVAKSGGPKIKLTSLSAGAKVGGVVELSPTVTPEAGTRIESVSFAVDGEVKDTDTGAAATWDFYARNQTPGRRTVTITARDTEGVTSELSIPVMVVAKPSVTLSTPKQNATVTGTITVAPKVSTPGGMDEVRYFLNGKLRERDTTTSTRWSFNTATAPAGVNTIRIQVVDDFGETRTLFRKVKVVR